MATQIASDPFARATLMRETIPVTTRIPHNDIPHADITCAWCGGLSYKGSGRYGACARLFRYYWASDDGRWDSRRITDYSNAYLFCSVGCWRTYHN